MKIFYCLCLSMCLFLTGRQTFGQEVLSREVTLKYEESSLITVLLDIQRQTGFNFLYEKEQLKNFKPVTINVEKKELKEVLEKLLAESGFGYKVTGRNIAIGRASENKKAEQRSMILKGIVKDEAGVGMPGVTVRLLGSPIGAATDIDGAFALTLPVVEGTLEFSFIGFESMQYEFTEQDAGKDIIINLSESTAELDEVVVTGIFKKAKESYTGSVSTIDAEDLRVFKGQNLLQTLKNADASLNFAVNNLAGSNPNALPQINIRGNSSLPISVQEFNESASNAVNTPLIIMDGFEISLEKMMDYNDDEIASINILKDAAATAIYGSRGSNGVIVIVTKQPEAGKLRVSAEVGIDMEVPDLTSYDLLDAVDKLELENRLGLYNSKHPTEDMEYQSLYNKRLQKALAGATTDWLNKPIRTGVGSHYNLRLEGGSEAFRWSAALSYKDIQGAMKNSGRRTFNGSITLMYSVKNLIFRNYTSYGNSRGEESNYGEFSDYVAQQPYMSPYDEQGNLLKKLDNFYGPEAGNGNPNPLYDAMLNTMDKQGYEELTNNFSIEWKILEGLTLRGQFGITGQTNHSDWFLPAEHSYFTTGDNAPNYRVDDGFFRRGRYEYGTGRINNYSGNLTLSYTKLFKEKHQLYVGLDYSLASDKSVNYGFVLEGFSSGDMDFLGNARGYEKNGMPRGTENIMRRMGFTGNVNYIYDGRYYVDLSARVDGSSTFGSEKKYAPFWSAGIGWNIHGEDFMTGNGVVNILRLKASYGQTGSQHSGSGASTLYAYDTGNKYMNWTGSMLKEWGNSLLTWQSTDSFNVGAEIGIFQGRVKAEFDFYTKKTSNLLSNMDLPLSMGRPSYTANVGEVKNRGWEASLNAYLIRDAERELNWMISGQLVYDKNWISELSEAVKEQTEEYLSQDVEVANLFYEGRPQNSIYAVRSLGIDPSTGQEIFLDREGRKTQTWAAGDKVFLGSKDALYRGNLSTMLMWKGWTFNMSFGYYWGGKVYNQTLVDRVEVTIDELKETNVDSRVFTDRWQKPGDVAFYKGFSNEETRASSRFVMPDNVLELQSVSLSYRWDNEWVRKYLRAQSVTFGVNMSDLFHWSSTRLERGTSYPFARNIQGSIKFSF